jgi:pimeloyl-ACP methyl ester carboxylesterase
MKAKMTILTLIVLITLLGIPTAHRAQGTVDVGRERRVISGYVEPNTPGAPGVMVDPALAAAITDPAAFDPDGRLNLNKAIYVRYFDRNRTAPPSAIIVLIPGTIAGANSFKIVANEIVRLSGGRFEVWAIDRRTNLLEDLAGMIQAENAMNMAGALGGINDYLNHAAGPGGYIAANPFSVNKFMAEWGLDVHLRDFKAVVDQARAITRNVFLGGHSLGSIMTEMFAAYNFDGTAGFELIKGMILMDGTAAPGAPSSDAQPISDTAYLDGGAGPLGPMAGLNQLRMPTRRFDPATPSQPGHESFLVNPFGPIQFQLAQLGALLALIDPEGPAVLRQFAPTFVPVPATNAAALAMNIDDEFQDNPTVRFSIGVLATSSGATLDTVATRVNDGSNPNGLWTARDLSPQLQRWNPTKDLRGIIPSSVRNASLVDPSDFNTVMRAFLVGDGNGTATVGDTNFIEWYFGTRMVLDLFKVIDLGRTPPSQTVIDAQKARGGNQITLTENRRVNVPALAIRAAEGIIQSPPPFSPSLAFVFYRQSTSIPGNAFTIREMRNYAHADVLTSLENTSQQGKNVPEFIIEFVNGGVQ